MIGPSDRVTVEGLSKFTKTADPLVQYGSTVDRAAVTAEYVGVIENFRVREVRGVPQYYGVGYKSYGPRSQRNPLRVRLGKNASAPQVTAMTDPRAGNATSPLQNLMLFLEFGVGVMDRTAATPRSTQAPA